MLTTNFMSLLIQRRSARRRLLRAEAVQKLVDSVSESLGLVVVSDAHLPESGATQAYSLMNRSEKVDSNWSGSLRMNRGPWFSVPCARIPRILGRSRVSERLRDEGREAQRQTTPSGIAARFFVISARIHCVAAFPAPDQEPIQRPIPQRAIGSLVVAAGIRFSSLACISG
jgi:hypothetical protein